MSDGFPKKPDPDQPGHFLMLGESDRLFAAGFETPRRQPRLTVGGVGLYDGQGHLIYAKAVGGVSLASVEVCPLCGFPFAKQGIQPPADANLKSLPPLNCGRVILVGEQAGQSSLCLLQQGSRQCVGLRRRGDDVVKHDPHQDAVHHGHAGLNAVAPQYRGVIRLCLFIHGLFLSSLTWLRRILHV